MWGGGVGGAPRRPGICAAGREKKDEWYGGVGGDRRGGIFVFRARRGPWKGGGERGGRSGEGGEKRGESAGLGPVSGGAGFHLGSLSCDHLVARFTASAWDSPVGAEGAGRGVGGGGRRSAEEEGFLARTSCLRCSHADDCWGRGRRRNTPGGPRSPPGWGSCACRRRRRRGNAGHCGRRRTEEAAAARKVLRSLGGSPVRKPLAVSRKNTS